MLDWESIGAGSAAGLVSAILIALGWNRRIDKLEHDKAERTEISAIDGRVNEAKEDLRYLRDRIDDIYRIVVQK